MADDLSPMGEAVRRARQSKGLTIRVLSDRAGLSPRFLSDLENGKGNISIARLMQLGRALDVSLVQLVAPLDRVLRPRVFALVGLRGAGKSTVGRAVARRLELEFVELDERVEAVAGLPLAQLFEIHGEAYYRRLEREVLEELLRSAGEGLVVATGGGIVTAKETWSLLRTRARTVWLKALPEEHYQRVMDQGDLRPMENRPSAMHELRSLLEERAPLYAESDARIDTSTLGLDGAVTALERLIRARSGSNALKM